MVIKPAIITDENNRAAVYTVKPKNVNTKNINTGLFLTTFIKIALYDLCKIASSLNLSTLYAQCFLLSMLILNAQQVQLSIMLRNKEQYNLIFIIIV